MLLSPRPSPTVATDRSSHRRHVWSRSAADRNGRLHPERWEVLVEIDLRREGASVRVDLRGAPDAESCGAIVGRVAERLSPGVRLVVVDAAGLRSVDAAVVDGLRRLGSLMWDRGGGFVVENLTAGRADEPVVELDGFVPRPEVYLG